MPRLRGKGKILFLVAALFISSPAAAQATDFKEIQERIAEYRLWLEQAGSSGTRFWLRLDSSKRPHRLYIGEGFLRADSETQENFIEIFSHFLAGHPDKNMLIDIYNPANNKWIGEYGFGGFRLF